MFQKIKAENKIKSPRQLITPFSFRATKGEGLFRLDACSADIRNWHLKF